jgi:WD40 repeat protein
VQDFQEGSKHATSNIRQPTSSAQHCHVAPLAHLTTPATCCRYGNRGVQAAAFSADGMQLVTVCTDNSHTLFVWDWQRKQKLVERKSQPGAPPCVYGVTWNCFEAGRCGCDLIVWQRTVCTFHPAMDT